LDASGFNPAADPAGNIALQANRNNTNTPPFGNLPDGIIQFKGAALQVLARGAAGGDVTLNGTGRDTVPSVSSIGATGNISFQCNSLAMGDRTNPAALTAHSEKFTVLGNLTINATGAVWLGDISALNAVQVTAGAITLLARPGGQVLARVGANGAQLGDDLGTDIVAGSITFNVAPTGVIGGVNLLASPTRAGSVPGSAIDRYTGTVATADLFWDPPVPVFLDLRGKGPVVGGVGPAPFNLASALPQLDTKLPGLLPPLVESIDVALAKELRRLGIYARFVTRDERLHVIGGGWVFDDLLASAVLNPPQRDIVAGEVAGDPDVENSAFQVSERRLSPVQAAEAVRLYRSLYKVIDKDTGKETDRSGEIVARLDAAATAYRQAGGVTEIDGAGFRKFLASDPKNAPALVELEGLSELFRTVRVMGLTDKELQISRNTLLGQLKTEAMSKDELRSAVESR